MKIKLKKLWNAGPAFLKIFNSQYEDIKTTYRLSKIAKKINPELEEIEKTRIKLFKKYLVENENGQIKLGNKKYNFKSKDSEDKFVNEFNELLEDEIEIETIEIQLEHITEAKLKPNEINMLNEVVEFIESPEEEVKKMLTNKTKKDKMN